MLQVTFPLFDDSGSAVVSAIGPKRRGRLRRLAVAFDIAGPLGISVHDHIIVGKNGHASLKGMKLI
jgi:hypothetical protein